MVRNLGTKPMTVAGVGATVTTRGNGEEVMQ